MGNRIDLHNELVTLLGSKNVYFQPPESIKIKYPCIVYELNDIREHHADNKNYKYRKGYSVTIIDRNPDTDLPDKFEQTFNCRFDRFFIADNLNHYVFTLYY